MKTLKLGIICLLTVVSLRISAQIKVESDGRVGIGTTTLDAARRITTSGDVIFKNESLDESLLTRIIHRALNFERLSNICMPAKFPHGF
jgi:hypothetical protein